MTKEVEFQIPRAALSWILLAVMLVIIPQSLRMPLWISAIALACISWRWLIYAGKLGYPGRSLRVLIVIFTLAISITQLRSLGVGLDSAASLLTLGFVFKLIEMRYKRDIYVVISLCFVMSMVQFLYSQSALSTLYIALIVLVITAAMIALNRSSLVANTGSTVRMALKIGLQALPLTIVLFLLFPRMAPLWAVPVQNNGNGTGVTDEMSPGDIAQLGRSSSLAFRAQFENMVPPLHENLYWRGLVLDDFDGETWRRTRRGSSYSQAARLNDFQWNWSDRVRLGDDPIRYNIILEPTQQPWLYGLHLAEPESRNLYQSRNFEIFNNGLITKRFSYDLRTFRNSRTDLILLDSARRRSTELPESGNQQSLEFARELRASVDSNRDYIYAVLAHFQQNEFYYTLNPPLLGDNRVDDFLFNTQEGFCEHYASSFAFLMRAAGIPSRVVVGYQGAEYNRFEDYMMVYQYNAHAWNEVWLEDEGWVRFDPTAAVSPERIEQGVEAALRDDPAFLDQSLFSPGRLGALDWINTIRLRLDAVEYEWNRRVVNYDEEVQVEMLSGLLGEVTEQKVLTLLFSLAGVIVLGIAFTVITAVPGRQRDPVNRLYRQVARELDKIGLGRRRGEGPVDYCQRVVTAKPELDESMQELTRLYLEINYCHAQLPADQRKELVVALKKAVGQLRRKLLPVTRLRRQA
jgi:transglutaminase-like putative cysteine protease